MTREGLRSLLHDLAAIAKDSGLEAEARALVFIEVTSQVGMLPALVERIEPLLVELKVDTMMNVATDSEAAGFAAAAEHN